MLAHPRGRASPKARPSGRPLGAGAVGVCVGLVALASALEACFAGGLGATGPRRAQGSEAGARGERLRRCIRRLAGKGLRSSHNSFQEELFDREALSLDPSEEVDEPTANSLARIAEICQFSDKTSVLDVGCGAGLPLRFYENGGAPLSKLTGIDLSQGMLNHAKKSHPNSEFIKGDIHVFEDPDFRLFDRVVFNSCYQHLHDQELAIRHVCEELISGGGLLIISEPHGRSHVIEQKKANPRANLRSLPDKESLEGIVGSLGSGTTGVQSFTSSLLSVESMVDEEDFYCAVLRRSCADF